MHLFCAIDWASQTHYAVLQDPQGLVLHEGSFPHSSEGISNWLKSIDELRHGQPVALIFEATKHGLIDALLDCEWMELIPVHPLKTKMLQQLDGVSRGKSDPRDARLLCDYLRNKYPQLCDCFVERNLSYRILHERIDQETRLIQRITASKNILHSMLRRLCPEWDQLLANIDHKVYRELLLSYAPWDHPRASTLRDLLHRHNLRSKDATETVVRLFTQAQPLRGSPRFHELLLEQIRSEVRLLDSLLGELSKVSDAIHADFSALPNAHIFKSMPGVGPKLGPRLADFFGSDPLRRFPSKAHALSLAGQTPLTTQSGNTKSVHMRRSCSRQAKYVCYLWARSCSHLNATTWIRVYLNALKSRGDRVPSRYRKLGSKLLAILYRSLCDNSSYNEAVFLKNRHHIRAA